MTAAGISLIGIGLALVCAGLAFWPRAPRSDPAALDGSDEFRIILDALDDEDRRNENRDLGEPTAKVHSTGPAAGAMSELGKQRRPRLR
jgi:hypothetical protein